MVSPTPKQVAQTERVLVIFPGALGDLICFVPALRALARRHRDVTPNATLELMAREELARFAVDRIGISKRGYSIDRREVAALFAENLRPHRGSRGFFATSRASIRSSPPTTRAFAARSRRPPRPQPSASTPFVPRAGATSPPATSTRSASAPRRPDRELSTHISTCSPDDIAEATQALARLGLGDARVVLLFPGSGSQHKNWPAENFAALASALPPPMRALVVLGPAEGAIEPLFIARGIARLRDQPLGTIAGLARLAAGFVGNDSGVSHLAAAAGAPGVAIFGPTDPDRWRPLGRVRVVRALKLADLTPAEVASALREATAAP